MNTPGEQTNPCLLDLAGAWSVGIQGERHTIEIPGSLQSAGLGDPVSVGTKWTGGIFDRSYFSADEYAAYRQAGNVKVPFWLQPETHFVGEARYERTVVFPESWIGRRLVLEIERPHWKTAVWLDGREMGTNDSLSVPHHYDLGICRGAGSHVVVVAVDNTLDPDVGENSHSVSDHTQGNWNGIVGRVRIRATALVWIDDLQVIPVVAGRRVTIHGRLGRADGQLYPSDVQVSIGAQSTRAAVGASGAFSAVIDMDPWSGLWDEFTPTLHMVTVSLDNGEARSVDFGFREIAADGRQLRINGRKLFLRGTLDCAAFPRTGHPPTRVEAWARLFSIIKDHGLNHVRFHSWCPPEAAFIAADRAGLYVQVEVASWPNWSTTLGDGKPVDAWTDAETARIVRCYGNHPSFVLLCAGNEPGGDRHARWLAGWVTRQRAADTRRLYSGGAGWPEIPENDYHISPEPRIQHWGEGLRSRINATPPETRTDYRDFIRVRSVPVVSHEIGQWCAFPDFSEMPKYCGYLKPRNFEIFKAGLERSGLAAQARDFLLASGRLQAACYKEEIESALRTPEMAGFQLLGLSDFPGQGTALVGVLDAFWEEKGCVSPAQFRRFCSATVPLARLSKRVFTSDERLQADIELAHFGAGALAAVRPAWRIVADDGAIAESGTFDVMQVPIGAATPLGRIDVPLARLKVPARYRLVVALDATGIENDWDFWVYPVAEDVDPTVPDGVAVVHALDADTEERLRGGGVVVLMIQPLRVAPDPRRGPVGLGFSGIFWNTAWTGGQPPHTLGVLCSPEHPAFRGFPTDSWSNWNWWYPVSHAAAMILDGLPRGLTPIVQVIDDWFTNRKLGLVFEARVGPGRLLVTSIDLGAAVLDPVRRQLRASLLAYAAGGDFHPAVEVSAEQIRALITR